MEITTGSMEEQMPSPRSICKYVLVLLIGCLNLNNCFAVETLNLSFDEEQFQIYIASNAFVYCLDRENIDRKRSDRVDVCVQAGKEFERQCVSGNLESCHKLGALYRYRGGIVVDKEFARRIYKDNCLYGFAKSCNSLKREALTTSERNYSLKAIQQECGTQALDSCLNFAHALIYGNHRDPARGINIFESECERGNVEACYYSGAIYNPRAVGVKNKALLYLDHRCDREKYFPCRQALSNFLIRSEFISDADIHKDIEIWARAEGVGSIFHVGDRQFDKALAEFEKHKDNQIISANLWGVFVNDSFLSEETEAALDEFVLRYPKSVVPYLYRGAFYVGRANKDKGQWPRRPIEKTNSRGSNLGKIGRFDEYIEKARLDFERAKKLDSKYIYPHLLLARLAKLDYKFDKAREIWLKVNDRFPDHLQWWREEVNMYRGPILKHGDMLERMEKIRNEFLEVLASNPHISDYFYRRNRDINRDWPIIFRTPHPYGFREDWYFVDQVKKLIAMARWDQACALNRTHLELHSFSLEAHRVRMQCERNLDLFSGAADVEWEKYFSGVEATNTLEKDHISINFKVLSCERSPGFRRDIETTNNLQSSEETGMSRFFKNRLGDCIKEHPYYSENENFYSWKKRLLVRELDVEKMLEPLTHGEQGFLKYDFESVGEEVFSLDYGISADMNRLGMNVESSLRLLNKNDLAKVSAAVIWSSPNELIADQLNASFSKSILALNRSMQYLHTYFKLNSKKSLLGNKELHQFDYMDKYIRLWRAKRIPLGKGLSNFKAYVSARYSEPSNPKNSELRLELLIYETSLAPALKQRLNVAKELIDIKSRDYGTNEADSGNRKRRAKNEQWLRQQEERNRRLLYDRMMKKARER